MRPGIMYLKREIDPEPAPGRQIGISDRVSQCTSRHLEAGRQGDDASCIQHDLEREGGTRRNLARMRSNAVHGVPRQGSTSLGEKMDDAGW